MASDDFLPDSPFFSVPGNKTESGPRSVVPGAPLEGSPFFTPVAPADMAETYGPTREDVRQHYAAQDKIHAEEAAKSELANLDPWQRQALSGTGSAANTLTAGAFPWLAGGAAKVAGKMGVPGYEAYADMPWSDAKKEAERKVTSAQELYPATGLAGDVAGVGLGAGVLPTIGPAASPMLSGALTGSVYSGASGLAKEGNPSDAVIPALLGGAGGAIAAPIMERVISGATRLVAGGRPVVDKATGALTDEAVAIAKSAGLSDQEIQTLAPQLRQTFEQRGLTEPAAREARFAEFGVPPTRGMVDPSEKQLGREAKFADYNPVSEGASAAAQKVAGGPQPPLPEAVEAAVNKVADQATAAKKAYGDAYEAAGNAPGKFDKSVLTNVGSRLLGSMAADPKSLASRSSDLVQQAAKKLDESLGVFLPTDQPGVEVMHQTFGAVEQARKVLNTYLSAATNQTDKAGVRQLIDKFDQHVEDSLANGAFSGAPDVLDQWKMGRSLFSQYQDKYGVKKTGEEAGSLVKSILDGTKSPDRVADMMFSFTNSGDAKAKMTALQTFNQLKRSLGANAPELEAIKKSYIQQVMTPSPVNGQMSPKAFSRTADQVDNLIQGSSRSFGNAILSPQERAAMARYSRVMREAGASPSSLDAGKASAFTQTLGAIAPNVANAAAVAMGYVHPALGAAAMAPLAVAGRAAAIKESDVVNRYLAGRGPAEVPRVYRDMGVRQAAPLLLNQQQEMRDQYNAARPGHAAGGRVGITADMLISAAERAKKQINETTKPMLHLPDEHVVKALGVASAALEK